MKIKVKAAPRRYWVKESGSEPDHGKRHVKTMRWNFPEPTLYSILVEKTRVGPDLLVEASRFQNEGLPEFHEARFADVIGSLVVAVGFVS